MPDHHRDTMSPNSVNGSMDTYQVQLSNNQQSQLQQQQQSGSQQQSNQQQSLVQQQQQQQQQTNNASAHLQHVQSGLNGLHQSHIAASHANQLSAMNSHALHPSHTAQSHLSNMSHMMSGAGNDFMLESAANAQHSAFYYHQQHPLIGANFKSLDQHFAPTLHPFSINSIIDNGTESAAAAVSAAAAANLKLADIKLYEMGYGYPSSAAAAAAAGQLSPLTSASNSHNQSSLGQPLSSTASPSASSTTNGSNSVASSLGDSTSTPTYYHTPTNLYHLVNPI